MSKYSPSDESVAADGPGYCSELCSDPMAGTADVVDVWLLLEYRPVWKPKALPASDLADPIKQWVADSVAALAARGLKARPQLIRQPELESDRVRLLVSWAGRLWEFSGHGYDFLQQLDLATMLAPAGSADLPGARALTEPRYLVCTNGQRDLCCARFGLPVYRALREAVGDRVWQVTHLGGHRFAPNVLVLPTGLLYGRVHPTAVRDFLAVVEGGRVAFEHLRGRSRYPKLVQAAEAFAAVDGLRLLHVDGDLDNATVAFAGGLDKIQVRVARQAGVPVRTSCADVEPSEVFVYRAAD